MTEKMAIQKTEVPLPMVRTGSLFFDVAMFSHIQRVAQVFAASTMVPAHFQGNIPNCVIALNLADRMGVDPFMLFQNMYIVHGNPGIEAKLAIALANGCGRFEPLQFKHENKEQDGWKCIAYAKDIKSGKVLESAAVSIEMAKAEGWYNKAGSKWKTMPELMLEYRSAMFFARVYCPEVLLGLKTREELYDIVDLERSQNGTYASLETPKEPKVKPNYAAQELKNDTDLSDRAKNDIAAQKRPLTQWEAQELKDKLDAGDEEVEGYSWLEEEEPEPTPLEQGEPESALPDGVDAVEWFIGSRCTSLEKANLMLKVYKEIEPKVIEMTKSDEYAEVALGRKLIAKEGKLIDYLADIENRKNEVAEEGPTVVIIEDDVPPFEQETDNHIKGYDANSRLAFLSRMRNYKDKKPTQYNKVLDTLGFSSMNDVKHNVKDQDVVLGFMGEEFGE